MAAGMIWFLVACAVPAFLISFGATAAMKRLAPRWGLIDQPAGIKQHSTHTRATPLGGGLAIYLGFVVPVVAAQFAALWTASHPELLSWMPSGFAAHLEGVQTRSSAMWAILAAGTLLVVMGLIDDLKSLPWGPRLAVQLLVAIALVKSGVQATVFVAQPWIGMVLTVLWIVTLINSLNFLDNMDGLSGGIGLIASLLFATVMLSSVPEPRWLVGGALVVLAGSLAGFLCHNWPPATIFMGDSGSMFIGMLLASLTVLGTFYDPRLSSQHVILAPLCVLAVPLFDLTTVVLIRLSQGRSPFHPDKNHFSHRLVALGLSRRNAVLTVHLTTLTTGLGALILYWLPNWTSALLVIAVVICVLAIVTVLETAGRRQDGE
ncbi:MAG: undecaprenyl/decaprenyl-phosphate alpha-N-acetylglucosaminyl 1-phosphate transferase [Planctomycetaceae bacterium]|nr:undecaprenyl/decaprenyl-phosphate alpha-N-acetylglucosaminyl 1-phosphate transferase [Planctomycetaceae bacterium]